MSFADNDQRLLLEKARSWFSNRGKAVNARVARFLGTRQSFLDIANLAIVAAAAPLLSDQELNTLIDSLPVTEMALHVELPNLKLLSGKLEIILSRYEDSKRAELVRSLVLSSTVSMLEACPPNALSKGAKQILYQDLWHRAKLATPDGLVPLIESHRHLIDDDLKDEINRECIAGFGIQHRRYARHARAALGFQEALNELSASSEQSERRGAACNVSTSFDAMLRLASDDDKLVRIGLASNSALSISAFTMLATDLDPEVRRTLAGHAALPPSVQIVLAGDRSEDVRVVLAVSPLLTLEAQQLLAKDRSPKVKYALTRNDFADEILKRVASQSLDNSVTQQGVSADESGFRSGSVPGVAIAVMLMRHARETKSPDILRKLVTSPDPDIALVASCNRYLPDGTVAPEVIRQGLARGGQLAFMAATRPGNWSRPSEGLRHHGLVLVDETGRALKAKLSSPKMDKPSHWLDLPNQTDIPFKFEKKTLRAIKKIESTPVDGLKGHVLRSPRALQGVANEMRNCLAEYAEAIIEGDSLAVVYPDPSIKEQYAAVLRVEDQSSKTQQWFVADFNSMFNRGSVPESFQHGLDDVVSGLTGTIEPGTTFHDLWS